MTLLTLVVVPSGERAIRRHRHDRQADQLLSNCWDGDVGRAAAAAAADRWRANARGTHAPTGMGRRPTFAELFIAFKPLTYFAAAPPRKVTDSACSLPSRRHCLFNRAATLIKVVDTLPRILCYKMLISFEELIRLQRCLSL